MNSGIKSLVNKIDYNTYMKICNILPITNFTMTTINVFALSNYPILNTVVNVGIWSSIAAQLYLTLSDNKIYTKDITEIRNLYNEFVKNYNELNKAFEFNDPIQIHVMYNYLLYKGYLSKNKNFEFSDYNVLDVKSIMGTNIMNGMGVCRHISSLLTDILNDYGMASANISCYLRQPELVTNLKKEATGTKEEFLKFINNNIEDKKQKEELLQIFEYFEKKGVYLEAYFKYKHRKDLGEILYGNHVITYVENNNNNYFLDPTQNRIYRLKNLKKRILFDKKDDKIEIKSNNYLSEYSKIRKNILSNEFISKEEESKLISDTLKLCEDYINVFESFYKNNHELYEEIVDKLIKVKRI